MSAFLSIPEPNLCPDEDLKFFMMWRTDIPDVEHEGGSLNRLFYEHHMKF